MLTELSWSEIDWSILKLGSTLSLMFQYQAWPIIASWCSQNRLKYGSRLLSIAPCLIEDSQPMTYWQIQMMLPDSFSEKFRTKPSNLEEHDDVASWHQTRKFLAPYRYSYIEFEEQVSSLLYKRVNPSNLHFPAPFRCFRRDLAQTLFEMESMPG